MFSELVDRVMRATQIGTDAGRIEECASYVNSVRRQMHMRGAYVRDREELEIEYTGSSGTYVWQVPRNARHLVTAKYKFGHDDTGVYAKLVQPSAAIDTFPATVYRAGDSYVFNGLPNYDVIQLLIQKKSVTLTYFPVGERPAVYNREEDTWSYLQGEDYVATLGSDALDEAARNKVYDWMLLDYEDVAFFGAMNLSQKVTNDERASRYYALYRDALAHLHLAEGGDTLGTTTMVGGASNA